MGMGILATVMKANGAETSFTFWHATPERVTSVIVIKCSFASWALEIDFIS